MGLTFKENCNDTRNSKVFDIYNELLSKVKLVDVFDPNLDNRLVYGINQIKLQKKIPTKKYEGIIIAVKHKVFINIGIRRIRKMLQKKSVIYDIKSTFNYKQVDKQL